MTHTGPPLVRLAQSSGSWGEWPLLGPSLGGAAGVGGPFFTLPLCPHILGPSLQCPLLRSLSLSRWQLGVICPGASCVSPGLSPPCTEEKADEARVHGSWWSRPHPTPAPGLSVQDQGRKEG